MTAPLRKKTVHDRMAPYTVAVVITAAAALLRLVLVHALGELPPFIMFYPAVMLSALAAGWRSGLLATLLTAFLTAFFFLPPFTSFEIFHLHDAITVGLYIVNAVLVSFLADKVRSTRIESAANRISEERVRSLAEALPHNVWSTDQTGKIDYYNRRASIYTGIMPDDTAGYNWAVLIHPDDLDRSMNSWKRSLEAGQEYQVEHRLLRADGAYRWHFTRAVPLPNNQGIITRWIGTSTDIEEQKQVFDALRESEERFRILFEKAGDAIFLLKAEGGDAGRIIATNKAAADMHGYAISQLLEMKITHLSSPEAAGESLAVMTRIMSGEWIKRESSHFRKDGSRFPVDISCGMIEYSGERFILVFVRDITNRKQTEQELKKREEEYRTLAENSPDFIARHDRQYRHIYVNNKIARFEGRDQQSFVGKTLEEIGFPPERAAEWNEIFRKVFETGKEVSIEFSVPTPDGERYIHRTLMPEFGPNGTVQTVLAIGRDITGRKQAEQALRRERDKAQQYLDISGVIILAIDRDQRISLINQKGCAVLGYTEREILGKNWFDHFLPGKERSAVKELFNEIINSGDMIENYENPVLTRDGSVRLIAWHNSAIKDQAGQISSIISSGEDITERRRTEDALRESEARNRNLINFTPLGMLLARDSRVEWVNKSALKMFGANTENDLLNKSIFDLLHPDYHDSIRNRINELKKGSPPDTREGKVRTLDGAVRDVEVTAVPFVNDRGAMALIMLNDITRRKQVEAALHESEERFRTLFEKAGDAIFMLEADGDGAGSILAANKAAAEMHGYTIAELETMNIREVDSPEDAENVPMLMKRIHAGEWIKKEIFHRRKDGSLFPVEISTGLVENGDQKFLLAFDRDITERKGAEEALRQSQQEYLRLFHSITDGIVIHPLRSEANRGNFIAANETFCRMVQYTEEELRSLAPLDIVLPGEISDHDNDVIRAEGFHVHEKTLLTKKGGRIPVEISTRLLEYRGSQMALSVIRDITERKKAENDIKKLNNELKQNLEKLAQANKELEAFSYSVSHDLRAPLMSIGGFADFLAREYGDRLGETGKLHLSRVLNNAVRMNQIIEDLLHLSRISRHELRAQEIDVTSLAASIIQELRQVQPDRAVTVDIQPGLYLLGDAGLVRIALSNLLRNAWKFTAKKTGARIEVGSQRHDDRIEYFVRDNGAGFDQTFSDKLFLPFHRLHSDQEFEGSGIGLAIVARVVRRHGGSIRAEGRVNEGATFFFTLS